MKNLLFVILILLQLSCMDTLSTMYGDLTMEVPVCVHFTNGNDSNDGRGWRNAKQTINGAIAAAQAGDEIWVAGTLTVTLANTINSSGKNLTFYGGFDGTESRRDQRDYVNKKTMLNGISNLLKFDGISCDYAFDGFTFENGGGSSTYSVFIYNSKYITIRNSLFSGGYAVGCTNGSEVVFEDCRFVGVKSIDSTAGGAISINANSTIEIKNSVFTGNYTSQAANNGGAISSSSATLIISGCSFTSNYTNDAHGGAIYCDSSTMEITGTIFKGNKAKGNRYGGVIYSTASSIKIYDCTLDSNTANNGATAGYGGAINSNTNSDLEITGSSFINNVSASYGGGIYLNDSKLIVKNSIFEGNTSVSPGGAIYIYGENTTESPIIIVNSLFSNNQCTAATFYGGGIYCINNSDTPEIYVINSTFYNNTGTSTTYSGSLYMNGGVTSYIYNSIFYSNSGSYSIDGGTAYCYNNAWDKGKSSGGDTVNTQVLTSSPFMSTDYGSGMFLRISAASSCVNTGLNNIPGFTMPETDLGGFPRIVDGTVDIGAYEYQ